MRVFTKRIVPILLAIAVIGCAVWYLFVYDRDFTRDLLVTQARHLDDAGHHELAAWFYDQAYRHADNDDAVAIELAQQYKDSGNCTKAEYTLTKAISANPSVALYTALCKTFVEQDKLIDAVALLDNITDPLLKQELDALRPAAPLTNQTPGFFNQYIDVTLSCDTGTLLYSTDREYPSVTEDFYTEPFTLGSGETKVYTLSVGENGLVSPLAVYGYTVGGVIEEVTFADPAIEAEIRKILEISPEDPVYSDALWTIDTFTVPQDATVYTDLSKLTGLTSLTVYNAKDTELGILSGMPQLQELTITGCTPNQQALSAIGAMSGLNRLTLAQCNLSDISQLSSLSELTYLDLSYNFIKDLSALSHMSGLETLYLTNNAITNLTALYDLPGLKTLNVSHNSINSLLPICGNRNLTHLTASNNQLVDLGDLDLLPKLEYLDVSYNRLDSIAVLNRCRKLSSLDISDNLLEDLDPLAELTSLSELDCSYNSIRELPDWTEECGLIRLDASYNNIKSVSSLGKLQNLNQVNLDYNSSLKSVEALADCPNLVEVDLFGTKVTDVSMLTEQSIIVNYNPTDVDVDTPEIPE